MRAVEIKVIAKADIGRTASSYIGFSVCGMLLYELGLGAANNIPGS